ncbi:C40 family peptidase, partial [Isoptericola halotolerans]
RSAERTAVPTSTGSSESSTPSAESTSSESTSAAPAADGSRGSQVVSIAARYIGTKYVVGGASPSGFDCSGLVTYAYAQVGVTSLPRSSSQMVGSSATTQVSRAEAQPGDLIWSPGHISIYIGNGQQIEATRPGGWTVRQSGIWQSNPTFLRVTG